MSSIWKQPYFWGMELFIVYFSPDVLIFDHSSQGLNKYTRMRIIYHTARITIAVCFNALKILVSFKSSIDQACTKHNLKSIRSRANLLDTAPS